MYCWSCIKSFVLFFFFFKQKTAYEMRISDWSSDVCSSDLRVEARIAAFTVDRAGVGDRRRAVFDMDARFASLDRRIGGIVDDRRLVAVEVEIDAVATAPGDRAAIGDSETLQVTEAGDAATRPAGDRPAVRDFRGPRQRKGVGW